MNYFKLTKFHLTSVIAQTICVVKKVALEKKLRDKAPHLLNTDGDCCHHFHNSLTVFCEPFNNFVEKRIDDLHADNKWSKDIRDALKEICFLLNISFRMSPLNISNRWLSLYDRLAQSFMPLYYFTMAGSLITRNIYKKMCLLYKKYDLNEEAINSVKSFHVKFNTKNLTKERQERKENFTSKLLYKKSQFQLTGNFFLSVLLLLKHLVLLILEQKKPLIHRVYWMLYENLKLFLCLLPLRSLDSKGLKSMDAESGSRC